MFFLKFTFWHLAQHLLHERETTTKQKTNPLMSKTKPDISCYKWILSFFGRQSMCDYPTSNYRLQNLEE